jgi:2'-5' RNA ligase
MRGGDGTERLFFAVFPPNATLDAAMNAMAALRKGGDGVAWVRRETLHFTLRFLGDTDAEGSAAAADAAREAAAAHAPFAAALGAAGAFPDAAHARVLWLGLAEGVEPLRALARTLQAALAERGFGQAVALTAPHLTLGRLREPGDWRSALAEVRVPRAAFRVERLSLVRSTLSPGGSRYAVITETPLGEQR